MKTRKVSVSDRYFLSFQHAAFPPSCLHCGQEEKINERRNTRFFLSAKKNDPVIV
jgi:hypothetical protein